MNEQFEYKMIEAKVNDISDMEKFLNKYGERGWSLCFFDCTCRPQGFIFKRQKAGDCAQ